MKLKPILDKIIVDPVRDIGEKTTDGGIVLPSARREKGMTTGLALAVGPLVKDVKGGDTIYFNKRFCGQEVTFGQRKILIMREEEVLAKEA